MKEYVKEENEGFYSLKLLIINITIYNKSHELINNT